MQQTPSKKTNTYNKTSLTKYKLWSNLTAKKHLHLTVETNKSKKRQTVSRKTPSVPAQQTLFCSIFLHENITSSNGSGTEFRGDLAHVKPLNIGPAVVLVCCCGVNHTALPFSNFLALCTQFYPCNVNFFQYL